MLKAAVSEDWIHKKVQSFAGKNKEPGSIYPSGLSSGAHRRLMDASGEALSKARGRQDPLPAALPARKQYSLSTAATSSVLGDAPAKHYGPGWSSAGDKLRDLVNERFKPISVPGPAHVPIPEAPKGLSRTTQAALVAAPLALLAGRILYQRHQKKRREREMMPKTAHDIMLMALADELEKIAFLKDDPSLDPLLKEAIFGNVGRGLAAIGRGIKNEASQLGGHVGQEIAQQAGRPMNPMMPVANLPGYAAGAGKYIASKFGKGHLGEAAGTIAEHAVHPSAAGIKPALTHGIEGAMHGMGALGHLAAPVVAPAAASLAAGGAGGLFKRFAGRAGHAAGHALHTVVG